MVITLLTENQMDSDNTNLLEIKKENGKNSDFAPSSPSPKLRGKTLHSISIIMLYVLDTMLLIVLLPFMLWQWISASDRLKIVVKAIAEVTLELLMWVIFAGVSILMTATFVLEDIYFRKNDSEKLRQLLNESITNDENINKNKEANILENEILSKEKDKLTIPDNSASTF